MRSSLKDATFKQVEDEPAEVTLVMSIEEAKDLRDFMGMFNASSITAILQAANKREVGVFNQTIGELNVSYSGHSAGDTFNIPSPHHPLPVRDELIKSIGRPRP